MSNIPALGARSLPASLSTANRHNDGKTTGAGSLKKAGIADTPISLSNDALDMQKRVASVGNATVDFAQDFVSNFTQALFGDAAKGATIDFDSASLEASSSYALGVQHTEGPSGSSDAAAFKLSDSSHFIGKGTITTADGRKFDFEVEVQYNYDLSASASQTQNQPVADDGADKPAAGTKDLPTVQVPNIDFPGTLSDLFKLIGRDLQTALSNGDKSDSKTGDGIDRNTLRSLSLRLLNLVDSKDTNTYAPPVAADKAKSATNAYDAQAADANTAPKSAAAPAPAPAPAPVADPASATPAAAASGDNGKSPTAASS
jgi:hypothetical protein